MNKVLKLIKSRRSVRRWTEDPVRVEDLRVIIEAGLYAPSGANTQKTKIKVLDTPKEIDIVCQHTSDCFKYSAPDKIITVLYDLDKPNNININYKQAHSHWQRLIWQDTAACIQNMSIMAEELGLKTCWVSIRQEEVHYEVIAEVLGIPDNLVIASFLFIGNSTTNIDINTFKHHGMGIKRDLDSFVINKQEEQE